MRYHSLAELSSAWGATAREHRLFGGPARGEVVTPCSIFEENSRAAIEDPKRGNNSSRARTTGLQRRGDEDRRKAGRYTCEKEKTKKICL